MAGSKQARWFFALFVGVAMSSAWSGVGRKSGGERRPGLILISVDSVGASWLRAFNPDAAPLPAVDAWASGAVRFSRALSTASWTLPAHASLLTGRYPDRHGATHPRRRLAAGVPTLAEILLQRDVETVAFTDGNYLDPVFGLNRGFLSYDRHGAVWWPRVRVPRFGRPNPIHGDAVFDRAIAYLSSRRADDGPYFLFLHTHVVHDYFMRDPVRGQRNRSCLVGEALCGAQEWAGLRSMYRDELRVFDSAFARLLAAVRRMQPMPHVVLTSDHGEGFDFEQARIHHAGRLDQDVLGVPLIIGGLATRPRVVPDPVSLVDVAPTILELVGAPVADGFDGTSLLPFVEGRSSADKPVFAFEYAFQWKNGRRFVTEEPTSMPMAVAVVQGSRWFVRTSHGSEQAYGVESETARLELRRLALQRFAASVVGQDVVPSRTLAERLRALGYLQ